MESLPASTALRNSCTASLDATSPEAWPPIPSATTKSESFLSTRKLSSLISRFLPTSVAAQKERSMRGPRPHNRYHESQHNGTAIAKRLRELDSRRVSL